MPAVLREGEAPAEPLSRCVYIVRCQDVKFGLCATASESSETQCLLFFPDNQRALGDRRRSFSGTLIFKFRQGTRSFILFPDRQLGNDANRLSHFLRPDVNRKIPSSTSKPDPISRLFGRFCNTSKLGSPFANFFLKFFNPSADGSHERVNFQSDKNWGMVWNCVGSSSWLLPPCYWGLGC